MTNTEILTVREEVHREEIQPRSRSHFWERTSEGSACGYEPMGDLVFTEQVLRDLFLSLDTSGDGYLSYQELWDGLNGSDVDWDELNTDKQLVMDRLWVQADKDGNDRVSFAEFWELIAASRSATEEEMSRVYEFFKMLDKSGDGAPPRGPGAAPEFMRFLAPNRPIPRNRPVPPR